MSASLSWRGVPQVKSGMDEYARRVKYAVVQVMRYWAPVVEAYAKQNASWIDRTGNARQGLRGFVDDLSETTVTLYLAHSVSYGVYLELAYQARYAIILPTLQTHYEQIRTMLAGIFK